MLALNTSLQFEIKPIMSEIHVQVKDTWYTSVSIVYISKCN